MSRLRFLWDNYTGRRHPRLRVRPLKACSVYVDHQRSLRSSSDELARLSVTRRRSPRHNPSGDMPVVGPQRRYKVVAPPFKCADHLHEELQSDQNEHFTLTGNNLHLKSGINLL